MTAAVDPWRVGLQDAERGREIQRPPPPASVPLVIPRAAPPAMRAAVALLRARADRDHQHLIKLVEIDLLDHRSAQPEQRLPYPERAHVATVPFIRFLTVRSQNRRSTAACAPSCPEVGRSQRPDLIAPQRGRRRLSSSANPATSSTNLSRTTPALRRCLIRRRRPRYPATAFTSPTEPAGEPPKRRSCRCPPAAVCPSRARRP
jgi:hypothetical protein